jgi:hypothetical protein
VTFASAVHRRLELSALQRLEEIAAQHEGHDLRGGEGQGGDSPEPVHQAPSSLAIDVLRYEGESHPFEGFEIAAEGPQVLR